MNVRFVLENSIGKSQYDGPLATALLDRVIATNDESILETYQQFLVLKDVSNKEELQDMIDTIVKKVPN